MRYFNDKTTENMTCKPTSLDEIPTVTWHGENLAAIPVRSFSGGLKGLDRVIEENPYDQGGPIEFIALDDGSNDLYLVNTEGYSYTRYAGRLTPDAADELIEAQADDAADEIENS